MKVVERERVPPPAIAAAGRKDRPYRGVRMRKWGKWVAEIREPNKRSRIWLGSYCTPVAAAKAYDTAVYFLRGRSARLNFPEEIENFAACGGEDLDAASTAAFIRKKATEVGARVDALLQQRGGAAGGGGDHRLSRICKGLDLNERPPPDGDSSDEDSP